MIAMLTSSVCALGIIHVLSLSTVSAAHGTKWINGRDVFR